MYVHQIIMKARQIQPGRSSLNSMCCFSACNDSQDTSSDIYRKKKERKVIKLNNTEKQHIELLETHNTYISLLP